MKMTHGIYDLQSTVFQPFQALMTTLSAIVLSFAITTPTYATGSISLASFYGDYAGYITGVGGKVPVSIVGILSFNGDGTGSANTIWNLPGPTFKDREIVPRLYEFNYEVDENGIVVMKAEGLADTYFVATRLQRLRNSDVRLALEIQGMSGRLETSGGNIVVGTGKRLPSRAHFDDSSLQGVYGNMGTGQGGRLLTAIGYTTLNGDGTGHEQSLWNLPDPVNVFERQLALLSTTITYTVDSNGIGTARIVQADGLETEAWFVVTEARRVRSKYIANELFVVQNEVDPVTGDLLSGSISRVSN